MPVGSVNSWPRTHLQCTPTVLLTSMHCPLARVSPSQNDGLRLAGPRVTPIHVAPAAVPHFVHKRSRASHEVRDLLHRQPFLADEATHPCVIRLAIARFRLLDPIDHVANATQTRQAP